MSVLIVGSVAFDTVEANNKKKKELLGGSAVYSAMSASYFSKPYVIACVGTDFRQKYINLLNRHNIHTSGIAVCCGKTFRWAGKYSCDLNHAHTLHTKLNVFADFVPVLSEEHKKIKYVFLANVDTDIQEQTMKMLDKPKLIALDTMNFWIKNKLPKLKSILKKVNLFMINEDEAKLLSKEKNIIKSSKIIMGMGPDILVIKRGEFGAMLFYKNNIFSIPSFPTENVQDTTGAGDTFAGGFIGYMSSVNKINFNTLKKAMVYGSIMSSFNVESFSLDRLSSLNKKYISDRFKKFRSITEF